MGCLEVLESIASTLLSGLKIKNSQGVQTDPATEATLQAVQQVLDELTIVEGVLSVSGGGGGTEGGEIFYPYYNAGEIEDIDSSGANIETTFHICKTMIGNVGSEQVTATIDEGPGIPIPAGASIELTHAETVDVELYGLTAGHVVFITQGITTIES